MHIVSAFLALTVLGNLLGYVLIIRDKKAAKAGGRRRPEDTFSMLALLGWWPGMLLAMRRVRHKTRKRSFQVQLAISAIFGTGIWVVAALALYGLAP